MAKIEIPAPRLNANEDEVLLTEILVSPGASVSEGDPLFSVETTKSSFEVESPASGTIAEIVVDVGNMVAVGSAMAFMDVAGSDEETVAASETAADSGETEIKITAKARARARELGVDTAQVPPKNGRIGVAEVEAFANREAQVSRMKAIIVGGGGHGATIGEVALANGWDIVGALDSGLPVGTKVVGEIEVMDSDTALEEVFASGVTTAFLGIGGATSSKARMEMFSRLQSIGFYLPPLVDPTARLGQGTRLGAATYVLPQAMVGPHCQIGANVIVNSSCTVAHGCIIEDNVHLTPASVLAGDVSIGEGSVIGMSATVLFGCRVGRNCLVHNNVSVLVDLPDNRELAFGKSPQVRASDSTG